MRTVSRLLITALFCAGVVTGSAYAGSPSSDSQSQRRNLVERTNTIECMIVLTHEIAASDLEAVSTAIAADYGFEVESVNSDAGLHLALIRMNPDVFEKLLQDDRVVFIEKLEVATVGGKKDPCPQGCRLGKQISWCFCTKPQS